MQWEAINCDTGYLKGFKESWDQQWRKCVAHDGCSTFVQMMTYSTNNLNNLSVNNKVMPTFALLYGQPSYVPAQVLLTKLFWLQEHSEKNEGNEGVFPKPSSNSTLGMRQCWMDIRTATQSQPFLILVACLLLS